MRLFLIFMIIVLNNLSVASQEENRLLESITEKFNNYCRKIPREEIYVHSDREEYIAGEDLWFKIYLFDRQSSTLSSTSKIAYFEILNPDNRPIVQERIMLVNGYGPGKISLPDTISSGYYILRAYTNWMKNFMPDNCFMKAIMIHNALNGKTFSSKPEFASNIKQPVPENTPSSLQSGLSVVINKIQPENVEIIISTDRNFRSANRSTCYLFIQTHGIINYKNRVNLQGDSSRIIIAGDQLIPGINHITVFNFFGQPVNETYIYTPDMETKSLKINSHDSFRPGDKIELGIETGRESLRSESQADFSISVAPTGGKTFLDIADYMIFGSEFGILPEEIQKSGIDNMPEERHEKFLSGIKSNWIDWKIILPGNYPPVRYERESEYHFLYGRLLNRNSQIPENDQYIFMSIPGKNAVFQYAKTDNNGDFCFSIPIDENIKDLIIQPEEVDKNNNIKIETSFSERYPVISGMADMSAKEILENVSRLAINYQVMKIYGSDEPPRKSLSPGFTDGSKRFYGKPDIELVMDDYIKLPVMQEVFYELMPGIMMRKVKSEYEITIADPVDNRIYDKPPTLFIDGVVVKDPDIIADLDPELVEKIDAIKSRYFVGDYLFYGLVNVITRAGDFSNTILPDYAVRLPYRVTEPAISFTSNDYSSPEKRQSRIPDFRNTLYWNPSIAAGENAKIPVEFWSSDFRSDYEITVQGITSDGRPASCKKIIKVR